ncbi:ATP-binding protein [Rhizobium sp. BK068]|uniref:ATP-binding protein n=1 Tax=Rhizobium sp. BK068 TaxID=2512130 RepID=UPI001FE00D75|nr:ATP-binding protein [Rhizobium sp. BK068]
MNTRLTRLLGETYRSSEVALKELIDNAWDADAHNVWITLPSAMTRDAVLIRDDGAGMTALQMQGEYLNIASDKRTRSGERSPRLKRRIKGRKGIGKFAGLALANRMEVSATARGRTCTLAIDKSILAENELDLEAVPLPFEEVEATGPQTGTTITLTDLDDRLNFPTADRLREVLIFEYGREDSFKVYVDGVQLTVEDVPGTSRRVRSELPLAGHMDLHYTIADGKKPPRSPGIVLRVGGKAVGRPMHFGLDDDEDIPTKLAKRVFGEVDLTGNDEFVTADWGGVMENSKAFQELKACVFTEVKKGLQEAYAREMNLQKARLEKQLRQRLEKLPEHRRRYAEEALSRLLKRYFGESDERIATIAEVALDAMEHDAYWLVLDRINTMSKGDVGSFAEALEEFGLLELSAVAQQARRRLDVLDFLDKLIGDEKTLEKDIHKALESNLWVLGRHYATMASNKTLRAVIKTYCDIAFSGVRAAKRPDLLLSQDYRDRFLLIEFKRPSHPISRQDIAQAEQYRDDLSPKLSSAAVIEVLMAGRGRVDGLDAHNLAPNVKVSSYASIISSSRSELGWLLRSLE